MCMLCTYIVTRTNYTVTDGVNRIEQNKTQLQSETIKNRTKKCTLTMRATLQ